MLSKVTPPRLYEIPINWVLPVVELVEIVNPVVASTVYDENPLIS